MQNNPEKSSTANLSKHIPSGFSMFTVFLFRRIENKHGAYRSKDCMKNFCESLRQYAMKIMNFENKKLELLTKEQQESYKNPQICYICE